MSDNTSTERRLRFERLVREAERQIEENPSGYKARIVALALLGYLVLFGLLAALVALIAGSLWGAFASTVFLLILLKKKLIIPLVAMAWIVTRALWVRVQPPQGYVANRQSFPVLHAQLNELRKRLRTPTVHQVILSDDFNAAVVQTPRLGVFGWTRNTVIVGLPLLLALTPEQARAVLAHEFGHLSGNHSRFNNWVYRLRLSWYRIMAAFDQTQGWSTKAMRRFFDWYAPYFNAYSFALARGNEYEADAVSVELTSVESAAQALVSSHVYGDVMNERYWKPLLQRADREATAESRPFSGLAQFVKENDLPREAWLERIRKATAVETGHADTHPALRDRLQAMRAPPVLPSVGERNAAEAWLGSGLERVLDDFDRIWLERNAQPWKERYQHVQDARGKLTDLRARAADQLTQEERWNIAAWTEQFDPDTDALPLYQSYQAHAPEDRNADFAIGRILLDRKDETGLQHLQRAMEKLELALPSCEVAYGYFMSIGDKNQADHWRRRGESAMDTVGKAREERQQISVLDTYADAQLNPLECEKLSKQLAAFDKVKHAWIARKVVKYATDNPLYVIAVEPASMFTGSDELTAELAQKIETPGLTYFIKTQGELEGIAKKVTKVGVQLV